VLIGLVFALAVPGGAFVFSALLQLALVFVLVMCVTGVFAGARFRRHVRRYGQSVSRGPEHHHEWRR
jgi:membrane protein implicated in regulation of membrane protease activity